MWCGGADSLSAVPTTLVACLSAQNFITYPVTTIMCFVFLAILFGDLAVKMFSPFSVRSVSLWLNRIAFSVLSLRLCFLAPLRFVWCLAFAYSAKRSLIPAECGAAADTREPSAALVSFQRQPPSLLPTQNVNSADVREHPASHFSGKYAKNANFVNQKRRPFRQRFQS
ncbi:MAG: hypothetical protein LCI00_25245 [Chloroflexi bacterium]|nr:hypothetical protein [Chloroflexota bacterium]MCC6896800.1 hypothetical protein [Anaerolineae bacterium]